MKPSRVEVGLTLFAASTYLATDFSTKQQVDFSVHPSHKAYAHDPYYASMTERVCRYFGPLQDNYSSADIAVKADKLWLSLPRYLPLSGTKKQPGWEPL